MWWQLKVLKANPKSALKAVKKSNRAWGCSVSNGVYHGDILYVIKLWGIILMFSLRHINSIAQIF